MALTLIDTRDYAHTEEFGVKGMAEIILRAMVAGVYGHTLDFAYSSSNGQSLRKAGAKLREEMGATFTFEKCGNDYREVTYTVARDTKNGKVQHDITRKFLNVEAIRVTYVQAEANAAIAADAS
jgi:hypothetical protein